MVLIYREFPFLVERPGLNDMVDDAGRPIVEPFLPPSADFTLKCPDYFALVSVMEL